MFTGAQPHTWDFSHREVARPPITLPFQNSGSTTTTLQAFPTNLVETSLVFQSRWRRSNERTAGTISPGEKGHGTR